MKHPFDADGMVTAITINNGKALFRNRLVRTRGFLQERKAKRINSRGAFGTQRAGGWLSNIFDIKVKNVANTNVIHWDNNLYCLWEAGRPHALEAGTLRTLGESSFKGLLKPDQPFSAHPKIDANTGRLINFSVKTDISKPVITIYEFENTAKPIQQRVVEVNGFGFFHDFVVTKNYYAFVKAAVEFSPLPFLLGQKVSSSLL